MKNKSAKLSKAEQEEVEAAYHNKNPQEFDELMSRASVHHPERKSHPNLPRKPGRKSQTAPKPLAPK